MIPGLADIFKLNPVPKITNLGDLISELYKIAFPLVVFLAFFWLVWGAFQYISAGGDKQKLAGARSRIIWAIVGLIITSLAFLVAQFAQQIVQPRFGSPIL